MGENDTGLKITSITIEVRTTTEREGLEPIYTAEKIDLSDYDILLAFINNSAVELTSETDSGEFRRANNAAMDTVGGNAWSLIMRARDFVHKWGMSRDEMVSGGLISDEEH